MTSDSDDLGKRGTTGTVTGSVVPEFSWGPLGLPIGMSPTEVSLGSRPGDRDFLRPAWINPENIILPAHDPALKKSSVIVGKAAQEFFLSREWMRRIGPAGLYWG